MKIFFKNPHEIKLKNVTFENSITNDEELTYMTDYLKQNKSIQKLSFLNNSFTFKGLEYICKGLEDNDSIETLSFEFPNKWKFDSLNQFEKFLEKNHSVTNLDIINLKMISKSEPFMNGLKSNKSITYLNLKNSILTHKDCQYLGECLLYNNSLQTLILKSNKINGKSISYLMENLDENKSLTHLDLSHNMIDKHGCKSIGKYFSKNGNLKVICYITIKYFRWIL